MSKQKQLIWQIVIIVAYVAIALLGFGVAYIIKITVLHHKSPTPSHVAPAVTSIPAPKGWKTYTDPDYPLQFAYPSTDTIKASSYGFNVSSIALQDTQGDTDFQVLLMPKSLAQMVGQDFDSYYAMKNNTSKVIKSPLSNDNTTETFTKVSNTTVNGLRALEYTSLSSKAKPGTTPEIGTFIETKDNLVLISTDEDNKMNLEELINSFHYQQ